MLEERDGRLCWMHSQMPAGTVSLLYVSLRRI
jgi:hypothetical protein